MLSHAEKNIYLNFTKSVVDGFVEFVTGVEKHDCAIGDNELKCKLKLIGKKLQTIFNKWENTPDKNTINVNNAITEETSTRNVIKTIDIKPETLKRNESCDGFDFTISASVGDTEEPSISKYSTAEVSSSSCSKLESTPVPKKEPETSTADGKSPPLTRKEAEIIRKFKIENVKEEWVRGSNGFYVDQIQPGTWRCKPCDLAALSYANIISHVSGKAHFKKLYNYNRDSSETRRSSKNDITVNTDLSDLLSEIEPDLMKKDNGDDIIVPFKGYYCNACRGTLNSEEALRLHVSGGKHRKNCES